MSSVKLTNEKFGNCGCKTGCTNNRCVCKKALEFCDDTCSCLNCKNPLNGKDLTKYTICALDNMNKINTISDNKLRKTKLELPCGDFEIDLQKLLGLSECSGCGEEYFFSFCWNEVVQEGDTIHCEICKECRDWRGRHCDNCNHCTYGLTVECEYCNTAGPYADWE